MKSLQNYIDEALIKKDTKLDFLLVKDIFEYCRIYVDFNYPKEKACIEFKKAIEKWANDFDVKYVSYPIVFGDSEEVVEKVKDIYKELGLDIKNVKFNYNNDGLNKYFRDTTEYFVGANLCMGDDQYPVLCGTNNSLNMPCYIITDEGYEETATIIFEKIN